MPEKLVTTITCERTLAKPAIKAFMQAVLFQRAFGNIQPGSTQVCGITLPCIVSPDLEAQIDAHVDEAYRAIDQSTTATASTAYPGASVRKVLVVMSFCEERVKRTWYSKTVEQVPWEEYHLSVEMTKGNTERERNKIENLTKSQLSSFLMSLITFVDSDKTHTPAITNSNIVPFPWRVDVNPLQSAV